MKNIQEKEYGSMYKLTNEKFAKGEMSYDVALSNNSRSFSFGNSVRGLAKNETIDFVIDNPAGSEKILDIKFSIQYNGSFKLESFRDVNINGTTGQVTPFNLEIEDTEKLSIANCYKNNTFTGGTARAVDLIVGGTNPAQTVAGSLSTITTVLKAGHNFAVRFTNDSGTDKDYAIVVNFFELDN